MKPRPLRPPFPLLVVLLLAATSAWARLGETEAELAVRFGAPLERGEHSLLLPPDRTVALGPSLRFKQHNWQIDADLIDGRCARIHYFKTTEWTAVQMKIVLDANAQGAAWTEHPDAKTAPYFRSWKRADGATAEWTHGQKFTLTSPAYLRAAAPEGEKTPAHP